MYSFVFFTEVHFFVFLCLIKSAYGWDMVEREAYADERFGKEVSFIEERRKQVHVGEAPIYTDAARPEFSAVRTGEIRAGTG